MMIRDNYIKRSIVKNCITIAAVAVLSAAMFFVTSAESFAAGEDEGTVASDGYEPSEYRLANDAINEWEDRVLIAATDRLENEGRVYYAYGDYVNELISYFTKDDLDLSKGEAQDAIAEITDPKNARAGALSGYLYQIGGKPKDADSLVDNGDYDGKVYPEFDEHVRFANEEEYRTSELYLNNKAYIEERTNTVYESQAAMRKEMRELAEADRTYKEILKARPSDASATELKAPKAAGIVLAVTAALLLVLTALIVFVGVQNGTVSILLGADDEKWTIGNTHRDRHRIRKNTAIVLAIVVAICLNVVYCGLTYVRTIGSNSFAEASMDKGGVCQHGYMHFRDDVHEYLSSNSLPQNSLDRALTYRDYRFDYVKGMRSAIKSGSSDVVYRGIQESVEAQIDLMAYVTKKDSNAVVSGINEIFEDSLSAEAGVVIHDFRDSFKGGYTACLAMSIINLLIAAAMLIFQRHNIYKGLRDLAAGALAGTALWGAITAAVSLVHRSAVPAMADDHVYVMVSTAFDGFSPVMLGLLVLSVIVSAVLYMASWLMHRNN